MAGLRGSGISSYGQLPARPGLCHSLRSARSPARIDRSGATSVEIARGHVSFRPSQAKPPSDITARLDEVFTSPQKRAECAAHILAREFKYRALRYASGIWITANEKARPFFTPPSPVLIGAELRSWRGSQRAGYSPQPGCSEDHRTALWPPLEGTIRPPAGAGGQRDSDSFAGPSRRIAAAHEHEKSKWPAGRAEVPGLCPPMAGGYADRPQAIRTLSSRISH